MFCNEARLLPILLVTPRLIFPPIILLYPGLLVSPIVHYAISLHYMALLNSDKMQYAQGSLGDLSGQQHYHYSLHLVYILLAYIIFLFEACLSLTICACLLILVY
ncbi:uncharacterized protein BO72DRAFT_204822 [Aspergillus fijiensis CBS 313.89]|uniref:Uncharacterized protein n=1 Tax=Aspergillus fijiensis CBS 313.89 TaxID=1448319 RepID=A0A8G1RKD4_9EURO|nr:uncharacterized protein BO72DRAFT_204822 [Aspergillus fijiensis CBS 313.89]RAK74384.1 hypothetical protein BO72DRAFT_204822 [Aspergillus fijiensis CBS 313.89]